MSKRIPVFAANWKMNKSISETAPYMKMLADQLAKTPAKLGVGFQVIIAPPATHLSSLAAAIKGSAFECAAQNGGPAKSGAFTGEVSPLVLKELGVQWVIAGHSERRHVYNEDNALVLTRTKAALDEGLSVIFCVGEKLDERRAGKTFQVVESQLSVLKELPSSTYKRLVIAYEPVWAIGTGETATPSQAEEVHAYIRNWLSTTFGNEIGATTRILYGGSVKAENSKEIMSQTDVDGLLVGGASLDASSFASVVKNGLLSKL